MTEIVAAIAEARSHGDLKENAEYHAAKEEQSHNEGRITQINDIIARANVIDVTKLNNDGNGVNDSITLCNVDQHEMNLVLRDKPFRDCSIQSNENVRRNLILPDIVTNSYLHKLGLRPSEPNVLLGEEEEDERGEDMIADGRSRAVISSRPPLRRTAT